MDNKHQRVVIITGASSGIGAEMAKCFSQAGYYTGLLARNLKALEALNIPNSVSYSVDVTEYQAFKTAILNIQNQMGPIDCLINNAGLSKNGDFLEIDHLDNTKMIEINLLGVVNGIEIVLPGMRENKSGTIINISSVADRSARPKLVTYAATKAAVKSLSESLRVANACYGIRVCNVAPAMVATPMLRDLKKTSGVEIKPEDVAKAALWIYQQPPGVCIRDLVIGPTRYEP
jgi:NADP-dependent 3-hydroxy acid dehydrogenase YdfG